MKKIIISLICVFLFASCAYADIFADLKVTPRAVLKNDAAVKDSPKADAADVAFLSGGAEVAIIYMLEDGERINGRYGDWYRVGYGDSREGFLWTEDGLKPEILSFKDVRFYYTFGAYDDDSFLPVTLHATRNGRELARKTMEIIPEEQNGMAFGVKDPHGLDNVELVLHLHFSGEMCGVPISDYFFAWTGTEFAELPGSLSFGGEGVETSYAESILLPGDGVPWNTIFRIVGAYPPSEYGEYDEEYPMPRYDSDQFAVQIYRWDGQKAVPQKQNADILKWRGDPQ